jgi:hypothetical protein
MLGYYREPELTKDVFTADGWLQAPATRARSTPRAT